MTTKLEGGGALVVGPIRNELLVGYPNNMKIIYSTEKIRQGQTVHKTAKGRQRVFR